MIERPFVVLIGDIPDGMEKTSMIVDKLVRIIQTEEIRLLAAKRPIPETIIRANSRFYKIFKLAVCTKRILGVSEPPHKVSPESDSYAELCLDLDVFFILLRELYDNIADCLRVMTEERLPRSFSELKKKIGRNGSSLWPGCEDIISNHSGFDDVKEMRDSIAHHSTHSIVLIDESELFISVHGLRRDIVRFNSKYSGKAGTYYKLLPTLGYYLNNTFGLSNQLADSYISHRIGLDEGYRICNAVITGKTLESLHHLSGYDNY